MHLPPPAAAVAALFFLTIAAAPGALFFPSAISAASISPCGEVVRCMVDNGYYLVKAPKDWDGHTPLAAMVFFHGYRESAEYVMADQSFKDFADAHQILLVVPHGLGETWSFPGSPRQNRDEFAFVDSVLKDVKGRFPIDSRRLWAAGFSQGGSMVWNLACYRGSSFAAFAPISGAFWMPMPLNCPGGPVNLRHIHGMDDPTVPMKGRAIGTSFAQGDVRQSFAPLIANDRCKAEPDRIEMKDGQRCEEWTHCGTGKNLNLCLHDGGHFVDRNHLEASWRWVESLGKD